MLVLKYFQLFPIKYYFLMNISIKLVVEINNIYVYIYTKKRCIYNL